MIVFLKFFIGLMLILFAIAYFLWPIDIIPDIIPLVGWIDDVIALIVGVGFGFKMMIQ